MRIQRSLMAATAILAFALPSASAAEPGPLSPQQHDVFVSSQDGYHTYRIPAVIVTSKGTVLAFCEGRKGSRSDTGDIDLLVKRSTDGGLTWSEFRRDPVLVEPRCQGSIFRYDSGRVLFSNPAQPGKRTTMTVRLSPDECRSWPIGRVIWPGPAAYSCLGVLPDGTILCLYEQGDHEPYEKITLARITLDWLAK